MTEPDIRPVKTWRKLFYVSRELLEDSPRAEMFKQAALAELDQEKYLVIGEPTIHISQPLPPFEFGVDDEGNEYRRPDAVMVDVRVVER